MNELVVKLEEFGLIHTLPFEKKLLEMNEAGKTAEEIEKALAKEVNAIQEKVPLTLRQALTVLDENFGSGHKITSHLIDNKTDLGIELADKEIRLMGARLNNFIASTTKIMRTEDLAVLALGYHSIASNDETTFGISWKTEYGNPKPRPNVPVVRRWHFQTRGPADTPLDTMLGLERVAYVHEVLGSLEPLQQRLMNLRFFEEQTLEEVGGVFGVTRERIRHSEAWALRKLRSRRRARHLERVM